MDIGSSSESNWKKGSTSLESGDVKGGIDKPCGDGGYQMSILLHKAYLVKWSTKEQGGKKSPQNCPLVLLSGSLANLNIRNKNILISHKHKLIP